MVELLNSISYVTGPLTLFAFLAVAVVFIIQYGAKRGMGLSIILRFFENKQTKDQVHEILMTIIKYSFIFVTVCFVTTLLAYEIPVIFPPTPSPDHNHTPDELRAMGANVDITDTFPSNLNTVTFKAGVETTVIVVAKYFLPGKTTSPTIDLRYLSDKNKWEVIDTLPAEIGANTVKFSGVIKAPDPALLGGEPFKIVVSLNMLNIGTGIRSTVTSDERKFQLEK